MFPSTFLPIPPKKNALNLDSGKSLEKEDSVWEKVLFSQKTLVYMLTSTR